MLLVVRSPRVECRKSSIPYLASPRSLRSARLALVAVLHGARKTNSLRCKPNPDSERISPLSGPCSSSRVRESSNASIEGTSTRPTPLTLNSKPVNFSVNPVCPKPSRYHHPYNRLGMPIQEMPGGPRGPRQNDNGPPGTEVVNPQDRAPCDVFLNVSVVCAWARRLDPYDVRNSVQRVPIFEILLYMSILYWNQNLIFRQPKERWRASPRFFASVFLAFVAGSCVPPYLRTSICQSGQCTFGDKCRFRHITRGQLAMVSV